MKGLIKILHDFGRLSLRNILTLLIISFPGVLLNGQNTEWSSAYENLKAKPWMEAFFDPGTGNWSDHWFLDGERAIVKNTPLGMVFSGGPVFGDNGSHGVLWTHESFSGNIRIEFDYTRLDDINRAVNILYIQATGTGDLPYSTDIAKWSELREIPYMNRYFLHMNLLHVSYAAYPLTEEPSNDYVRARRYPVQPGMNFGRDTRIPPDYDSTGLFQPGIEYHFTFIKWGNDLFFEVRNEEQKTLFHWDLSGVEPLESGRIGIRHMYTRAARYTNFKVFTVYR